MNDVIIWFPLSRVQSETVERDRGRAVCRMSAHVDGRPRRQSRHRWWSARRKTLSVLSHLDIRRTSGRLVTETFQWHRYQTLSSVRHSFDHVLRRLFSTSHIMHRSWIYRRHQGRQYVPICTQLTGYDCASTGASEWHMIMGGVPLNDDEIRHLPDSVLSRCAYLDDLWIYFFF